MYGSDYGFLYGCPVPPGAFDHCADSLARIWKQFEGKPNIRALVLVICQSVQSVELASFDVKWFRGITVAEGAQLDALGELIDRPRNGLDDETYRRVLIVDLRTLFASGTARDLLELLRVLVGPGRDIRLQEGYPASFCIYVEDLTNDEATLFADILRDVPAAGVAGCFIVIDSDEVHTWESIHGAVSSVLGYFTSIHGPTTDPHGFAHAVGI